MRRRDALAAGGALLSLSAGCLETLEREDAWRELVVDPPNGVYVPPKIDEMTTYGTATVDGRTVSLAAARPHSFWTVTGTERSRADVRDHHAVHLMASVRDAETGTVVPTSVNTTIRGRENAVDERTLWPMLSQRMGFHYGDNVPLEADGSYVATVRVAPTSADATGGFADRLDTATTVDFEFDYAADEIEGLERQLIDADEGRGDAGALEPMAGVDDGDHGRDEAFADVADEWIGSVSRNDVEFAVALVDGESGTDDALLAVRPRTRYNRYLLPFAALSAVPIRDGTKGRDVSLRERLDDVVGHHYGARVERRVLERADELAVAVDTPPQVSRHEGYETAFLDSDSVAVGVDLE